MALLNIRLYGDPVLRRKAEPVENPISDAIHRLAADMAETMYAANGVGLAATQVGELHRVVVVDADLATEGDGKSGGRRLLDARRRHPCHLVNPEIFESSVEDSPLTEGCLSLPGLDGEVYRPSRVRVRYTDLEGVEHEIEVTGMLAKVLQHEIDHLDGVMFVDRMSDENRRTLAGALSDLRRRARENPLGIAAGKTNPARQRH